MKTSPTARDAYVRAETVTALAHQIRTLRMDRNWSQKDLAKKMGTTQAVVSRLEDPSYGRLSLKTLLDLSQAFDTGLQVRFISLLTMLQQTHRPQAEQRSVPSFDDEAQTVAFCADVRRPAVKVEFMSDFRPVSVLAFEAASSIAYVSGAAELASAHMTHAPEVTDALGDQRSVVELGRPLTLPLGAPRRYYTWRIE